MKNLRFENLVNLDISKTTSNLHSSAIMFENLVNLDISKTGTSEGRQGCKFENLVNCFYDDAIKIIIIK